MSSWHTGYPKSHLRDILVATFVGAFVEMAGLPAKIDRDSDEVSDKGSEVTLFGEHLAQALFNRGSL